MRNELATVWGKFLVNKKKKRITRTIQTKATLISAKHLDTLKGGTTNDIK